MMREGAADSLVGTLGDEGAVEIEDAAGAIQFAAIVGKLRIEPVEVTVGSVEEIRYRDICQVHVRCPAGAIVPKQRLNIFKYTTGDASTHDRQRFYVHTIDSVTEGLTVATVWRESLAKRQARGTEQ